MARSAKKSKPKARPASTPSRDSTPAVAAPRLRPDARRMIYSALDLIFAVTQFILIWKVIPNRLPSASFHLYTLPFLMGVFGLAMLYSRPIGWYVAVIAGSAVLLSATLLIVRIIVSAAFLSGVYGAFGKAAAMTAMISVALLVELVVLLPIVQVKYLMSRAGRKAFGIWMS